MRNFWWLSLNFFYNHQDHSDFLVRMILLLRLAKTNSSQKTFHWKELRLWVIPSQSDTNLTFMNSKAKTFISWSFSHPLAQDFAIWLIFDYQNQSFFSRAHWWTFLFFYFQMTSFGLQMTNHFCLMFYWSNAFLDFGNCDDRLGLI